MQYKCPECDKYFNNKDLLNRHAKRLHQNQVKYQVKSSNEKSNSTDDKETCQCGACGAMLDGKVSPCPYCDAELNWS